jgi:hypothetical protein
MYFAMDPLHDGWAEQVAHELGALHTDMPLHLLAMVDSAFDEGLLRSRPWARQTKLSLYADTALQTFGAAAPHLLTGPAAPTEHLPWLKKLQEACAGKPMLGILASTLDAPALLQHLRPYLVARTPDSLEWPLRWGDTRVLPSLLDALDAPQRKHLLEPLAAWWSTQRNGELARWTGGALPDALPDATPDLKPAEFDKLPLTDATFTALVDGAEADAILANIYDSQPDVLQPYSPAQCHARVARHLALASQHRIEAAPDRQHFSVLALCLTDNFANHPAMAKLLQHTLQGMDYQSEVAALPPDFWQDTTP